MTTSHDNSLYSLSSTKIQQVLHLHNLHSRRLLLHAPLFDSPPLASPPVSSNISILQPKENNTFDANVVMVLSVLLCALICSLGLNSIIRCALRCSTFVSLDSTHTGPSPRLANRGIKKKDLKKITTINYGTDHLKPPISDTECAICLSDFAQGERVKVLPKCHHGFHVRCIDKWLNSHSSCPTCRHCLIESHKIIGCGNSTQGSSTTSLTQAQQQVVIRIEPLQPEGLIRNHET